MPGRGPSRALHPEPDPLHYTEALPSDENSLSPDRITSLQHPPYEPITTGARRHPVRRLPDRHAATSRPARTGTGGRLHGPAARRTAR